MCRGCCKLLLVILVCAEVGCWTGSSRDVPKLWKRLQAEVIVKQEI